MSNKNDMGDLNRKFKDSILELESSARKIQAYSGVAQTAEKTISSLHSVVSQFESASSSLMTASEGISQFSTKGLSDEISIELRKEIQKSGDSARGEIGSLIKESFESMSSKQKLAVVELGKTLKSEMDAVYSRTLDGQRDMSKQLATLQSHVTAESLIIREDMRRLQDEFRTRSDEAAKKQSVLVALGAVIALLVCVAIYAAAR